jgi:hypothetical protein
MKASAFCDAREKENSRLRNQNKSINRDQSRNMKKSLTPSKSDIAKISNDMKKWSEDIKSNFIFLTL